MFSEAFKKNHANANQKRTHLWRRTWHIGQQILGEKTRRVGSTCFWPKRCLSILLLLSVSRRTYHDMILLMEDILHQLKGSVSHDLKGFIHPRWLFRMSSINNNITVYIMNMFNKGIYPINTHYIRCIWDYVIRGPPSQGFSQAFSQGNLTCKPPTTWDHQASSIRSHAADSDKADAVGSSWKDGYTKVQPIRPQRGGWIMPCPKFNIL